MAAASLDARLGAGAFLSPGLLFLPRPYSPASASDQPRDLQWDTATWEDRPPRSSEIRPHFGTLVRHLAHWALGEAPKGHQRHDSVRTPGRWRAKAAQVNKSEPLCLQLCPILMLVGLEIWAMRFTYRVVQKRAEGSHTPQRMDARPATTDQKREKIKPAVQIRAELKGTQQTVELPALSEQAAAHQGCVRSARQQSLTKVPTLQAAP